MARKLRRLVGVALATYWVAFLAYVAWGKMVGYPLSWPEDRSLANVLAFFLVFGPIGLMLVGSLYRDDKQDAPTPVPKKPDPTPFRVEDLGRALDQWKRDEDIAKRQKQRDDSASKTVGSAVAPAVHEAIELVNAQLSGHAMQLVPDGRAPDVRGKEPEPFGFGATYTLLCDGLPVSDGTHSFVATESTLYVANIGEIELPIEGLTARKIADAAAESMQWFLKG